MSQEWTVQFARDCHNAGGSPQAIDGEVYCMTPETCRARGSTWKEKPWFLPMVGEIQGSCELCQDRACCIRNDRGDSYTSEWGCFDGCRNDADCMTEGEELGSRVCDQSSGLCHTIYQEEPEKSSVWLKVLAVVGVIGLVTVIHKASRDKRS